MKQLVFEFLKSVPEELRGRAVLAESMEEELLAVMAEAIMAVHVRRVEGSDGRPSRGEQDHRDAS